MPHHAATPVSLRRSARAARPWYPLLFLLALLFLVPACGGDAPTSDGPPTPPAEPDATIELTADIDPVDFVEEVVEGAAEPPAADVPLPANDAFDEEQTAALYFLAGHSAVVDTVDAMRNIERQLGR